MPHKDPLVARQYKSDYYKRRRKEDLSYSYRTLDKWREKHPKQYMISRVRCRARNLGIPFDLNKEDFEIPEYCPIFPHLKLEFSRGRDTRPDNIPTLDRIIPELGYVKGNVAVISMRANRLKSDATLADLEAIIGWIKNQTGVL